MRRAARLALTVALPLLGTVGNLSSSRANMPPPPPRVFAADAQGDAPQLRVFGSPAEALARILTAAEQDATGPDKSPRVVAFGEYHETTKNSGVPSALKRFTQELLAVMQPSTSDLVLETWITEGNCGKQEKAVVKDVKKTTQRPVSTEDELVTLAKQAKATGVQPHILNLSCKDYDSLLDDKGQVDYEKMLTFLAAQLHKKAAAVSKARADKGISKIVAIYGGALHNDLTPAEGLEAFTFGPAVNKSTNGRYLEVDLYVPEFIDGDEGLKKQAWYPLWQKEQQPGKTVVVRRGPQSYIMLFPRSPQARPAPQKK